MQKTSKFSLAALSLIALTCIVHAQETKEEVPSESVSLKSIFTMAFNTEHDIVGDEISIAIDDFIPTVDADEDNKQMKEIIETKFLKPIIEKVHGTPPYGFSYSLLPLTGDGYNSLILWPRIYEYTPRTDVFGGAVLVYTFNGKSWVKQYEGNAFLSAVRPQRDANGNFTGAQDIALVQSLGYIFLSWDKKTGKFIDKGLNGAHSYKELDELYVKNEEKLKKMKLINQDDIKK